VLFVYPPEFDASKIHYVKGSLPLMGTGMFIWNTGQLLDMSALASQPNGASYSTCGAGGFSVSFIQSGSQVNGAPNLFGFAGTWRQTSIRPIPEAAAFSSRAFCRCTSP
jgi:hypothetical protein